MTQVKICGVAGIETALLALEAGADMLGFVFAPSRRQVAPETAAEIVEQLRQRYPPGQHPWLAVGVFADQPLDLVLSAIDLCRLDIVQLSGHESAQYCRGVPLPVYKTIHVMDLPLVSTHADGSRPGGQDARAISPRDACSRAPALAQRLRSLQMDFGATRLLLDSGSAGRLGGTGKPFRWETVGLSARECLVAGGLDPSNVALAIELMQPWGVDVSSGVEKDGRKDPGLIQRFISQAKRSEDNGCAT